jgi:tetratricopeptide (TPR) repeat protein
MEGFQIGSAAAGAITESLEDASEEEAVELPMMGFDDSEDDDEGVELPIIGFDDSEDDEEAVELPIMGLDDSEDDDEEAVELPLMGFDDSETTDEEEAFELPTIDAGDDEDEGQAASEALQDAFEEVAADIAPPAVEEAPAPPAEPEPAAPAQEYIDLAAMILGGGGEKKTTRFQVAYEEPTGDEEADFAKMLSQFKEKVSENLDTGDVRAHYDLGTAYKEMGLLEEAISSFQKALRASSEHLPTYEIMGQTFIEMGRPEAAVRTLQRALQVRSTVEDELVGIYYYLARAFEALDKKDSALEYYDRVFALDINFADVTERLRELR